MFDVQQTIAAATAKNDPDVWKEYQDEQRAKFLTIFPPQEMVAKVEFGQRLIEHGETDDARAEGHFLVGDIDTAISMVTDTAKKAQWQKSLDAIQGVTNKCACKVQSYATDQVLYQGQVYSITKCPKCQEAWA